MTLGLFVRAAHGLQHAVSVIVAVLCLVLAVSDANAATRLTLPGATMIKADQVQPLDMRGYGTVSGAGANWQLGSDVISLVTFTCQNNDKAAILGSKYIADITNYGAVKPVKLDGLTGAAFEVRYGGTWLVAVDGKHVHVLSARTADAVRKAYKALDTANWQKPRLLAYPRYLDNFDNAGLAFWWMPTTKPADQMKWFTEFPAQAALHYQATNMTPAPGVMDFSGTDNAIAQMHEAGKVYRQMVWTGSPFGQNPWFSAMAQPGHQVEQYPEGHIGAKNIFEAGGYYLNQISTPAIHTFENSGLVQIIRNRVNDPNLLAWMEPHGEFGMRDPDTLPPNYRWRYPAYLQIIKKYSLTTLSEKFTGQPDTYKDWKDIPINDTAFYYGRRGHYLDLDDTPWQWTNTPLEDGIKADYGKVDFDDSKWTTNYRDDMIMLSQYAKKGRGIVPLWYRGSTTVSEDFLKQTQGKKLYLHLMPYTDHDGKWMSVWLNGQRIAEHLDQPGNYYTRHAQVEVTGKLKAGENHFTIYSNGGRIAYRVFISDVEGQDFPFNSPYLNQQYIDWRDYITWEKVQTLVGTLRAIRSVDPNRPIKLMTPRFMHGIALDLMERYGAYPQLTGEGAFYRPMHYKGYNMLNRMPGSSEPGGPSNTAEKAQHLFAMIFAESQDCHDFVFDFTRDFWPHKEVVAWWKAHQYLLRTVGKTDLLMPELGVLRDRREATRFNESDFWNWDLSRGSLPALGITPALVDGTELENNNADKLKVILDSATPVMDQPLVDAISRYVSDGGTFVAMFQTGQHSPTKRNTYPLAREFGLTVKPTLITKENYNHWPLGKIKFTDTETLVPSLQGKTCEGSGVSIDYLGVIRSGALRIQSDHKDATPIAHWEDGTMAIVEVKRGNGRFILLGTPFTYRFKDVQGQWVNDVTRQGYLRELLASLGIKGETTSSDRRVWFERRASKNGLYDVYFANALGIRNKDWKVDDRIQTELTIPLRGDTHVIDPITKGEPDVPVKVSGDRIDLGKQVTSPYGIRQYAVIRPNVGLEAPLHWLNVQWGQWRALEPVPASLADDIMQQVDTLAKQLGEAGENLNEGWKVRVDPKDTDETQWVSSQTDSDQWIDGKMGTWRVNGWTNATCVQYRKQVSVPADWKNGKSRIFLGFAGYLRLGICDKGKLWINGKLIDDSLGRFFLVDVTDMIANNQLDVAMQVTSNGRERGPGGTMYLRKTPAPADTMDLTDGWNAITDWQEHVAGPLKLPSRKRKIFGMQRDIQIPQSWAGKEIRLVIEPYPGYRTTGVTGMFIGRHGYVKNDKWDQIGCRIDKYLEADKTIRFVLLGSAHHQGPEYKGFRPQIKSIRLECMPVNQ